MPSGNKEWSHPIRCPFDDHKGGNEKSASFGYNFQKDYFNCFGCGSGGGVVEFICKKEGLSKDYVRSSLRNKLPQRTSFTTNLDPYLIKLAEKMRPLLRGAQREEIQKILWWFDAYLDQGELEEEELCARIDMVYQLVKEDLNA